jgi:hypothetical protein
MIIFPSKRTICCVYASLIAAACPGGRPSFVDYLALELMIASVTFFGASA